MEVKIFYLDETFDLWHFPHANDINKLVSAIVENCPKWIKIEISIRAIGPNLQPKE